MQYQPLGRTGLKISAIGFGAGQLQILERSKAVGLLAAALQAGINYIDIDRHNDETLLRDAVRESGREILYAGKSFAVSASAMRRDLQLTMKRFSCSALDMYCLHMVRNKKELEERLGGPLKELLKAKRNGTVRSIGISGHRIPILKAALELGHFDYVVVPHNIIHRETEDLFKLTRKEGIGVITFMTFGGGVLIDPGWGQHPFHSILAPELPLRFALSQQDVSCILVGTNKLDHLNRLLTTVETLKPMSNTEAEKACRAITKALGENFCRGCRYCIKNGSHFTVEVDKILRLKAFAQRLDGLYAARQEYTKMNVKTEHFTEGVDLSVACPYGLDVIGELKEAHKILSEPPERRLDAGIRELRAKISAYQKEDEHYENLLASLRSKIAEEPDNPVLYHHLGECLMEAGEYRSAIKWLKKATRLKKKINWTHFSIGKCYVKQKNYESALRHLSLNLEICTDRVSHFHSWYFKAICYHERGNKTEMQKCLSRLKEYTGLFGSTETPEELELLQSISAAKEPGIEMVRGETGLQQGGQTADTLNQVLSSNQESGEFGTLPRLILDTSHFRQEHYTTNQIARIVGFCIDGGLSTLACSDEFDIEHTLKGLSHLSQERKGGVTILAIINPQKKNSLKALTRGLSRSLGHLPPLALCFHLENARDLKSIKSSPAFKPGKSLRDSGKVQALGLHIRHPVVAEAILSEIKDNVPFPVECIVVSPEALKAIQRGAKKGLPKTMPAMIVDTSHGEGNILNDIRKQLRDDKAAAPAIILRLHTIDEAWEILRLLIGRIEPGMLEDEPT